MKVLKYVMFVSLLIYLGVSLDYEVSCDYSWNSLELAKSNYLSLGVIDNKTLSEIINNLSTSCATGVWFRGNYSLDDRILAFDHGKKLEKLSSGYYIIFKEKDKVRFYKEGIIVNDYLLYEKDKNNFELFNNFTSPYVNYGKIIKDLKEISKVYNISIYGKVYNKKNNSLVVFDIYNGKLSILNIIENYYKVDDSISMLYNIFLKPNSLILNNETLGKYLKNNYYLIDKTKKISFVSDSSVVLSKGKYLVTGIKQYIRCEDKNEFELKIVVLLDDQNRTISVICGNYDMLKDLFEIKDNEIKLNPNLNLHQERVATIYTDDGKVFKKYTYLVVPKRDIILVIYDKSQLNNLNLLNYNGKIMITKNLEKNLWKILKIKLKTNEKFDYYTVEGTKVLERNISFDNDGDIYLSYPKEVDLKNVVFYPLWSGIINYDKNIKYNFAGLSKNVLYLINKTDKSYNLSLKFITPKVKEKLIKCYYLGVFSLCSKEYNITFNKYNITFPESDFNITKQFNLKGTKEYDVTNILMDVLKMSEFKDLLKNLYLRKAKLIVNLSSEEITNIKNFKRSNLSIVCGWFGLDEKDLFDNKNNKDKCIKKIKSVLNIIKKTQNTKLEIDGGHEYWRGMTGYFSRFKSTLILEFSNQFDNIVKKEGSNKKLNYNLEVMKNKDKIKVENDINQNTYNKGKAFNLAFSWFDLLDQIFRVEIDYNGKKEYVRFGPILNYKFSLDNNSEKYENMSFKDLVNYGQYKVYNIINRESKSILDKDVDNDSLSTVLNWIESEN